jgi:hypothetical protein
MVNDKNCRKTWIYEGASGQGLCKIRYWKKGGAQKTMYPCQFSIKPYRKRKSLTVQGDFYKIIDVGRTELCFLGV